MKLINEALVKIEDVVAKNPPEGLLCLDACICIEKELCDDLW